MDCPREHPLAVSRRRDHPLNQAIYWAPSCDHTLTYLGDGRSTPDLVEVRSRAHPIHRVGRSQVEGRGRFEPAQNTYATFACLSNRCK